MKYLAAVFRWVFRRSYRLWHMGNLPYTWVGYTCPCNWKGFDWAFADKYEKDWL